jgi:hypothetical protein
VHSLKQQDIGWKTSVQFPQQSTPLTIIQISFGFKPPAIIQSG